MLYVLHAILDRENLPPGTHCKVAVFTFVQCVLSCVKPCISESLCQKLERESERERVSLSIHSFYAIHCVIHGVFISVELKCFS